MWWGDILPIEVLPMVFLPIMTYYRLGYMTTLYQRHYTDYDILPTAINLLHKWTFHRL
jgi:hypothetical protein